MNTSPETKGSMSSAHNCQQLEAFIDDYLDQRLPEKQKHVFESHIEACPPCKRYLERYQKSIGLCAMAYSDKDSEAIPDSLVQGILAAAKGQSDGTT